MVRDQKQAYKVVTTYKDGSRSTHTEYGDWSTQASALLLLAIPLAFMGYFFYEVYRVFADIMAESPLFYCLALFAPGYVVMPKSEVLNIAQQRIDAGKKTLGTIAHIIGFTLACYLAYELTIQNAVFKTNSVITTILMGIFWFAFIYIGFAKPLINLSILIRGYFIGIKGNKNALCNSVMLSAILAIGFISFFLVLNKSSSYLMFNTNANNSYDVLLAMLVWVLLGILLFTGLYLIKNPSEKIVLFIFAIYLAGLKYFLDFLFWATPIEDWSITLIQVMDIGILSIVKNVLFWCFAAASFIPFRALRRGNIIRPVLMHLLILLFLGNIFLISEYSSYAHSYQKLVLTPIFYYLGII